MKVNSSVKNMASIIAMSIALAGCGGGDGDGESVSNDTNTPVVKPPVVVVPPVIVPPVTKPPVVVPPVIVPPVIKPPVVVPPPVVKPPVTTPIPPDVEIQASTVPDGEVASAGLLASSLISLKRQTCSLGALSHDEDLAKVSSNHARYLAYLYSNANINTNLHSEGSYVGYEKITGAKSPYFTGITFRDRLVSAKYDIQYNLAENIAKSNKYNFTGLVESPETSAKNFVSGLLAAPYHLQSLMEPARKITGTSLFAFLPYNGDVNKQQGYVMVNTAANGPVSNSNTIKGIFTYPCEGVVDTVTALWNEAPSPVKGTGRDLGKDPIGQPIYIYEPEATSLKVSNIKVRDIVRQMDVPVSLLDYTNDPHIGTSAELPKNKAFILPLTDDLKSCQKGYRFTNCGLYANTVYQVSFDVLTDNKTLTSKSFKFTTGKTNM